MAADSHHSIGEVLALLKSEYPDVTISKIRFLESQGLLDPQRTASGYRKFYGRDIERLRWILRQQKENFLPLKVIKQRLDDAGAVLPEFVPDPGPRTVQPTLLDPPEALATAPSEAGSVEPAVRPEPAIFNRKTTDSARTAPPPPEATLPPPVTAADAQPATEPEIDHDRVHDPVDGSAADQPDSSPLATEPIRASGASLSAEELAEASGMTLSSIEELDKFGLISGRVIGTSTVYGDDALAIARTAARFSAHGMAPRHLRMYVVSAQREAGVLEQIVSPLTHKRDPAAREHVTELIEELMQLGDEVRDAMLRQSLHGYLSP